MSDLASFQEDPITNIFGRARCLFSGSFRTQGHHIMGRGRMKDAEDRKIHSSPLNYAPLSEEVHSFAPLHDPDIEKYLLGHARQKVFFAVNVGKYVLTEWDEKFMLLYPWPPKA